ncbi:hypothetical protein [Streptomyces sp. WM6378]|uniref:hypothetical protein n=1 Tax=Streptomyces sp. WM6378 TaxID=1415557 RepID=UPI0006AF534C|nr:hypothetical protein [Streptomyces sp. WM6378]KOU43208.1 hypothetical protein ADK54_17960 [Streptomyces sp. WM6378]
MSLEHSFLAVYGVELPGADWVHVYDRLEELRRAQSPAGDAEDVQLFTVSGDRGPSRVVIGAAVVGFEPGSCKSVRDFTLSPERDEVVRRAAVSVGHAEPVEPGWLFMYDLS